MPEMTPEQEAEVRARGAWGRSGKDVVPIRDLLDTCAALRARLAAVERENTMLRRQYQDDGLRLAAAERLAEERGTAIVELCGAAARLRASCLGCAQDWPLVDGQHVSGVTRMSCLFTR